MKHLALFVLLAMLPALHAQGQPRTITPGFVALNAANFGVAALDVALTRQCIDNGTCHEVNPLMKGSAIHMYTVTLGMATAGTVFSYYAKKHDSKTWLVAPIVGIAAHGFAIGISFKLK